MMNDTTGREKPASAKKGNWLQRNYISLLTFFVVIAIIGGLIVFYQRYPEKVKEFENYGYLGAFFISLLANATVIVPVPAFLAMFVLGAAFNPLLLGLVGGMGAAIGELTGYMLGYSGRVVIENRKWYDRAMRWLKRWGVLTIFVFALTPLPDDVAGFAAGILRLPIWKFLVSCFLGKALMSVGLAFAGAHGWEAVLRFFG